MSRATPRFTVIVLAKEPVPGRVKTRLQTLYTPEQAAALALAALQDTLETVTTLRGVRRVLALDGRPGAWLPQGWELVEQRPGRLGDRIAGAFDDAFTGTDGPVLLVGMDTPQLTAASLEQAAAGLADHDAVLGPAADGGWWLLGLTAPQPDLIREVPTSRDDTGARQLAALRAAGQRVLVLDTLRDIDTPADAAEVAAAADGSCFARTLDGMRVPA